MLFLKRLWLVLVLFSGGTITAYSQGYKTHLVYIFSFTKYVIWPDSHKEGDFQILVLGDSPIIKELSEMAKLKKTSDNRIIVVKKINTPEDIEKCNVLFIPTAKSGLLPQVLSRVGTEPILIITEAEGLGTRGSNINFITKNGKLTFEMNQNSMSKQNLKASSELSRLAIQI